MLNMLPTLMSVVNNSNNRQKKTVSSIFMAYWSMIEFDPVHKVSRSAAQWTAASPRSRWKARASLLHCDQDFKRIATVRKGEEEFFYLGIAC
jgi:hypothetical protein